MKAVLLIQSHVAHGYVGNKAAVFPLQCQGWDVDVVNTVNFSNHTGYGSFQGLTITAKDLASNLTQLEELGLRYQAMVTGYIPNAELISTIGEHTILMKRVSPEMLYLLDPVMGDNGYLYVDDLCIQEYRRIMGRRVVDITTPNQFELELLVEFKVDSPEALARAVTTVHERFGVRYVVVLLVTFGSTTYCAVLTLGDKEPRLFTIPIIKLYFTGVGDLFSALLLDKLYETKDLETAVNQVSTIMAKTLRLTHNQGVKEFQLHHPGQDIESTINDGATMKYFELKIVESRPAYASTETAFQSLPLSQVALEAPDTL